MRIYVVMTANSGKECRAFGRREAAELYCAGVLEDKGARASVTSMDLQQEPVQLPTDMSAAVAYMRGEGMVRRGEATA